MMEQIMTFMIYGIYIAFIGFVWWLIKDEL